MELVIGGYRLDSGSSTLVSNIVEANYFIGYVLWASQQFFCVTPS